MDSIAEIMEDASLSLDEIKSLLECLYITLEHDTLNNDNSSNSLLLARLTSNKFKNFQNNFSNLEDKIYRQILLN